MHKKLIVLLAIVCTNMLMGCGTTTRESTASSEQMLTEEVENEPQTFNEIPEKESVEIEEPIKIEAITTENESIQFLPEEYKNIYQEIKDEYTILQIIQWEKEYEEILRIEIMESIRNELEEITQNEREYTIANERNFLIEKRNLLKSISQEWVTKEGMLSELGEYYLDFISNELEGASESISVFASWFTDSKKYLEENFDDYTEDNWYFASANTQESALTYGEIRACITLYESCESIDESVAESSKEIDNAISTRNDRNSFKKGYLSGKSEQTLIEEFIVEIGTIMNGKE